LHSLGCSAYADADGTAEIYRDDVAAPSASFDHVGVAGSEEFHRHQGFFDQAKAFIQAVRSGKAPHNSLSDAARSMRLVEQVYRAAGRDQ